MTNKEIIRFIRQHKLKLFVPMQCKEDVMYVPTEKSFVIDMYNQRKDEYETGMEVHITNGDMYFDIDYNAKPEEE